MCGKATEATWEDRVGQGEVLSRRKRDVQKRVHIPHHQLINVQGFKIKYFKYKMQLFYNFVALFMHFEIV